MSKQESDRKAEAERRRRLAEALRENLKRRKSQTRGRRDGAADTAADRNSTEPEER